MTLQQIRYILEISRCGSISKAAQQLLLTQPYLSSILKDLENELGIVIFRRDRRGVTLTEEGREFLYYARPMLEQEERIEALYSKRTAKPPLHVSISTQRYPFVIQAFMRFFRQWDPLIRESGGVSLMFWAADGSEILDYNGRMEDTFEWAKWIGVANPIGPDSGKAPELQTIHERPRPFLRDEETPDWTYDS